MDYRYIYTISEYYVEEDGTVNGDNSECAFETEEEAKDNFDSWCFKTQELYKAGQLPGRKSEYETYKEDDYFCIMEVNPENGSKKQIHVIKLNKHIL